MFTPPARSSSPPSDLAQYPTSVLSRPAVVVKDSPSFHDPAHFELRTPPPPSSSTITTSTGQVAAAPHTPTTTTAFDDTSSGDKNASDGLLPALSPSFSKTCFSGASSSVITTATATTTNSSSPASSQTSLSSPSSLSSPPFAQKSNMPHLQSPSHSLQPLQKQPQPQPQPASSLAFQKAPRVAHPTPQPQPQKQTSASLSSISRNPSSSEETNSEENSSEHLHSNRSMSSIATSFDSASHRQVSKPNGNSLNNSNGDVLNGHDATSNSKPSQNGVVDGHVIYNSGSLHPSTPPSSSHVDRSNFPFPSAPSSSSSQFPLDASDNSISTATKIDPQPQSKYVQHSPKRALSTSSSASSISSHKLVTKTSASSLVRSRNFSTYRSPSPSVTTTSEATTHTVTNGTATPAPASSTSAATAATATAAATVPHEASVAVAVAPTEPNSTIGIAIDRPLVTSEGLVAVSNPSVAPEDIDPLDASANPTLNKMLPPPPPSQSKSSSFVPTANDQTRPANFQLNQRNSSSSQASASSRHSGHGEHSKNPMAIMRRRSLPPQQLASSQNMPPDERTVLYRERVVTMRELKRQKRIEYEEDERVLVGNKVSEGHVDYATAYYMLTGIRVSVSRCNAKINRELTDADFTARHKLAFDIKGNELIPSSKYDFKFKDYSPWVFRHLRELFQLDPADYLMSLTSKYIVSQLSSPGKSGSLFYFSRDYRFIIKTIHHSEHKMLRKILKDYYHHVRNNPNTLISQFYGLHRIKLPLGRKIHFIVMNNLFPPHHDLHRTYDLKGSTLGREYVCKDGVPKPGAVLKDLNWTAKGESLSLGPAKAELLINQLKRDVALLKKLNIMDYSLLIGIHDKTQGDKRRQSVMVLDFDSAANSDNLKAADIRKALNRTSPMEATSLDLFAATFGQRDLEFYKDDGGFQSTDSNDQPMHEIYYLGVIDCLTPYTFYKRVETFFKSMSHPQSTISAIPASEYGDRFFEFMKKAIRVKSAPSQQQHRLEGVQEESQAAVATSTATARGTGGALSKRAATASERPALPVVVETKDLSPRSSAQGEATAQTA